MIKTGGKLYKLSTAGATIEADEPQTRGFIAATVWYSFTPTNDGTVVADTLGSGYDTALPSTPVHHWIRLCPLDATTMVAPGRCRS